MTAGQARIPTLRKLPLYRKYGRNPPYGKEKVAAAVGKIVASFSPTFSLISASFRNPSVPLTLDSSLYTGEPIDTTEPETRGTALWVYIPMGLTFSLSQRIFASKAR